MDNKSIDKAASKPVAASPISGGGERYPPCLATLRGLYPSLTGAERRVADYVFANPDRVLLSSNAEVARTSGTGVGTLARLCTKLGYSGFPDMKIALAVELFNPEGDAAEHAAVEPIRKDDDAPAVVKKVLQAGMRNLADTAVLLDPGQVEDAASAIVVARRVELYAQGPGTGSVAHIFQSRFLLVGVSCAVHTHVGYQYMSAGLLGEGDVAVGLSQSGETEPVVRALRAARTAGATTVAITNTPRSAITEEADVCLLSASGQAGPASHRSGSYVAMLSVIEALHACSLLLKYRRRE